MHSKERAKIYYLNFFINMLNLDTAKINQLNDLDVYLNDINEFIK